MKFTHVNATKVAWVKMVKVETWEPGRRGCIECATTLPVSPTLSKAWGRDFGEHKILDDLEQDLCAVRILFRLLLVIP